MWRAAVLYSEEDEYAASHVDKEALVKTWQEASHHVSMLSGLIPGAGHTVDEPDAQAWMFEKVVLFLRQLG